MNRVTIIGNLTRDPESGQTAQGVFYSRFTVAVNRRFANADGERETDYFRVTAWRALGENCQKSLRKGSKVCVVGSVSLNTYTTRDGEQKENLEVAATEVEFLSPKEPQAPQTPYAGSGQPKQGRKVYAGGADDYDENDLTF